MKKIGIILGAAAVATFTGCKDPEYNYARSSDEAKYVEPVPAEKAPEATVTETAPATIPVEEPKCNCASGTTHATACACGASDCQCKVVPPKPAEPEYTIYIVQRGDILASISKKFNIKQASILAINPQITDPSKIKLGQKIKLPGKVEVGTQSVPAGAFATEKKASTKAEYKPYTGATKEYTVKAGDSLGAIAASTGISVRQLKELNSLSKDMITVGQKLKVPASKVEKSVAVATIEKQENEVAPKAEETTVSPTTEGDSIEGPTVAPTPEEEGTFEYEVLDGEDMMGVSIKWGVSPARIRELNNIADGVEVVPGQKIKLPPEALQ